jgi:methylated-DNA-[protein]-cysteine S-methyltransferase
VRLDDLPRRHLTRPDGLRQLGAAALEERTRWGNGRDHGEERTFSVVRRYTYAPTPVGDVLLTADGSGHLTGIYWPEHRLAPKPGPGWERDDGAFAGALEQLDEYFAGRRTSFDLPVAAQGTPFQHRVWDALREIRFGETVTYRELAERIGRPSAARAVGLANGRNPVSIVVPCHRVVGSGGVLTGYAGGLEVKRRLLAHERATS